MNRSDDFDQTLAAWLRREAPPQAPDRMLDAALQRVASQSQRRSWLQRLMGQTPMTVLTRTAAVTAVVAIAVLVGLQFSNLGRNFGGVTASPTVTTTPSPSATPSPTPSPSATQSPTPTASLPVGCVNPPVDLTTLVDATQGEQSDPVACYGNAPLTFDATWRGGGVADCPTAPEPAWLACSPFSLQPAGDARKLGVPELFVAVEPSASLSIPSEPFGQVRVTGHFDDPAAQTCRETEPFPGASPEPVSVMIERCRRQFVVTQVEPLE